MRNIKLIFTIALMFFAFTMFSQRTTTTDVLRAKQSVLVGVGTLSTSAAFEVISTTKGALLPRMTVTQRDNLTGVVGLLIYNTTSNVYQFHNGTTWADLGSGGGGANAYDGNKTILRTFAVGENTNATTLEEMFDWMYFAAPTITSGFSTGTFFEVGTSNAVTYSGATTNPAAATLSNGTVTRSAVSWYTFAASTTYSNAFTYAPITNESIPYITTQDWTGSGESGTATASTKTLNADYPVFHGMSATVYMSGAVPYATFTKLVQSEGDKTVSLTGTTQYIYYLIPKTWTDFTLSSILDGNGFEVLGSFTSYDVTVTSTGLTNNWTQDYKLYKLNNLTTATAASYQFIR